MNQMTICLLIYLTLLAYAFLSSRVSMAVISLISVAALMVTGCMDPNDALSCFANSSAILMASMFGICRSEPYPDGKENFRVYLPHQ
ncbi:MAG: hypothetical protein V8Q27_06135 [Eubacteriales bacterium]